MRQDCARRTGGWNGSVTVTVADPGGMADTASYTWTVTEVNVAPVLAPLGDQTNDEGDLIGSLVVGTIQPSGVVFLRDGVEVRQPVGTRR